MPDSLDETSQIPAPERPSGGGGLGGRSGGADDAPCSAHSSDISSSLLRVPADVFADLLDGAKTDQVSQRDYGERYEYCDVLGEGGQGVVVRARDRLLERDVAIKTLRHRHNPDHEQLLEREAKLCGRLEHPNILPTYDLARDEADSPLFVMKKIEGRSLEALLKELRDEGGDALQRSRLRLLNIFLQVLNAVAFAHARGVLHLDLKPGNISLGSFGEVYVIDWGFARHKEEEQGTLHGGTIHYIAPERMERKEYDERADIYALGALLYRLLTGRHPREVGEITFREYKESYRNIPLVAPRVRDRSIAPELEAIVMKAMADDPTQRYANAADFANDLVRFIDLLPVSAYKESIFGQARRFFRKHRRRCVAGAALLAMLAVTGVALWQQQLSEGRRTRAEQEKHAMERARAEAETVRRQSMRKRYAARRILDRALDLFDKSRGAVEAASEASRKRQLLTSAFALFDEAILTDPDYAEAYERRARARQLAFSFEAALADYEQAFRLDSSYIMSLYEAGLLLSDVFKQPDRARDMFREIEKYSPKDEYAELGQARVDLAEADSILKAAPATPAYAQREKRAEALFTRTLERCDRIEKVNPALSDVWYLRGLVYQKSPARRDPKKAFVAYSRYLASRRDSPSAFHNRGDARKDLEDYPGAIADYTEALKINPQFIWSLRNRGYLYYRFGNDPQKALADINRAMEINPGDYWSYIDRGAVREGTGDFLGAIDDYRRALRLSPDNPRILYRLGVAALSTAQTAQAEDYFTRAVRAEGEEGDALTLARRGVARLALDKYADAVSDFEAALRLPGEAKAEIQLLRCAALRLSGVPPDKGELGKDFVVPADKPWLAAAASLYLGEAQAADMLKLAGDPLADAELRGVPYRGEPAQREALRKAVDPKGVAAARFYAGLKYWADGDRQAALQHFLAAADCGDHLQIERIMSFIFLQKSGK